MRWKVAVALIIYLRMAVFSAAEVHGGRGRIKETNYHGYNPSRQLSECNGEENLKTDIGIVSFMLSLVSSTAGLISLVKLSIPSNNNSLFGSFISLALWKVGTLLTLLGLKDPFSLALGHLANLASLAITFHGGVGILMAAGDIIVGIVDEVLGITSVVIGAFSTFPELFQEGKEFLQEVLGERMVNRFLRDYGCGHF